MATIQPRRWRAADGTERSAVVVRYADQTGKWRLKTFKGDEAKARKAADAWLVQERYKISQGTHTPESTSATIGEAIEAWLARAAAEQLEFGTRQQYRQHRAHILKLIPAKTKLAKLTRARVEQLRDDLLKHHSREMARKVLVSFKSIMRDACRRGMVAQNVASETTIGRNGRARRKLKVGVDVPTPVELAAVLAAADAKAKAIVSLAGRAGLRASEMRGLKWSSVNLGDKPSVTVSERADKWARLGAPKSAASRRTIPLSEESAQALREWRLAQPPIVTKGESGEGVRHPPTLLFGTASDRPDMLGNLTKRLLQPVQVAAGVVRDGKAKYGWHSFRHYAISAWLAAGIDPKAAQTWAGHSSLMITLDIYGHFIPRADDHARIEAAEAALLG